MQGISESELDNGIKLAVFHTDRTVSLIQRKGDYSLGIIAADKFEGIDDDREGTWWLARLFVREECRKQGMGTFFVKKLQEEILKKPDFQVLIVAPGGYGSDPVRLDEFYHRQGFVDREDGALEWSRADVA